MPTNDLAALSEAATCPWKVGDKVQRKPGSSYDFPGIVISTGLKLNGTTWHCEVKATTPGFEGCTHVFPASGLVPMDPKYERLVLIDREGTRERVWYDYRFQAACHRYAHEGGSSEAIAAAAIAAIMGGAK